MLKKHNYIDSLRGIAVLGTLLVHCSIYDKGLNNFGDLFKRVTFMGSNGVQLFFILSSLTLYMSFDQKQHLEKNPILNFYIRRFFRIAPLFYMMALVYIAIIGTGPRYWLGHLNGLTIGNIITTFTFTNSVNPYWINSTVEGGWSISIEMMFYALFPVLFKYLKNINRTIWLLSFSLIFSSVIFHFMYNHPLIQDKEIWNAFCYFSFPSQLPVFLMGVVVFHLLKDQSVFLHILKNNKNPLLFFSSILVTHVIYPHLQDHILVSLALLIIVLVLSQSSKDSIFNQLFRWFGKLSFSMYLTHFVVLFAMWKMNLLDILDGQMTNFTLRYSILVVGTSILSYVTYKSIELPGIQIGKRIIGYFEK